MVEENEELNLDITLVSDTGEEGPKAEDVAEYIVQTHIEDETIGAEIDTTTEEDYTITLYADVEINVLEAQSLKTGNVSFTISGEGEGTMLVIYLTGVGDPEQVIVNYDGEPIEQATDLFSFFDTQHEEEGWIILTSEKFDESVAFVKIPHFSEHTITISSLSEAVEAIGGIDALLTYMAIAAVITIMFIGIGEISKRF